MITFFNKNQYDPVWMLYQLKYFLYKREVYGESEVCNPGQSCCI